MPPKSKYSKEQIILAAAGIVGKSGMEALSARSLAASLGCSPQPIFSCFANMEQVQEAVMDYAKGLYADYIAKGLEEPLPFKGVGMQYIRFAMEEPIFFQLLFMQDKAVEQSSFFPAEDENAPKILAALQKAYDLPLERAKALYNHISIYTHGLAISFLGKGRIFTIEDADRLISEIFQALLKEAQRND